MVLYAGKIALRKGGALVSKGTTTCVGFCSRKTFRNIDMKTLDPVVFWPVDVIR